MKLGLLFPGQGSQFIGMGKDFYENSELAREMFEIASEAIKIDFKKLMFEENDDINKTEYTQPAILLYSAIAYKLFEQNKNFTYNFSLGHSLGEFSALYSAGAMELADAIRLVHERGKLMNLAFKDKVGSMMVVLGLDDNIVEEVCKDSNLKVWPANYNSDGQIVIAGIRDDLVKLEPVLKEKGAKRVMLLNMSVASHCPLLESAVKPLKELLDEYLKDEFKNVVSNVTAKAYNTKKEALELLPIQLTKPVLYKQSIKNYENEADFFIEFGGKVLMGINRKITKKKTYPVTDMASLEKVINL
ncbi:[acyl-carrier-protein] S-malonyltransferase [Lebetimonas natsushimae]|uniref:Malonyl CoA-acyl carrier protein transacylase n=1 Tax=Lebetimonas natsushimae TaxID=1936991 RepID=A0A292YFW1_9BACT|nr:ACP S-malonyltransferase [Lebetimonas natsushimae]GAX87824.1 [acyl-carrier-protein] S-malonyltransferase [Lebetimonas natsushimae]